MSLILKRAEEDAEARLKAVPQSMAKPIYKHEYFAETPANFVKDHWDQWLLTESLEVSATEERIVFDNWNYA